MSDESPSSQSVDEMRASAPNPDPRQRWIRLLLIGILPTAISALAQARYIFNHFYFSGPYLLDAGWYSKIIHRSGFIQTNPAIACNYADTYYGIHVAPLTSVFSALSYLVPADRITWYAFFQAFIYAPLGAAFYLSCSKTPWTAEEQWRRLPIAVLAAIASAFTGQVFFCIGYPHYEVGVAGWICILLASLATGRKRLAYVALVLALSIREDAGVHAGMALAAFGWINERGERRFLPRRTMLLLIASAFVTSVVFVLAQKLVFHSANLLREEYLGAPTFGHVTAGLIVTRLKFVLTDCLFISVPFFASVLIAAVRRDAHYLLGWAAAGPWFVLNLLAHQEVKSHFDAYTGYPFIVSFFWVYLYGAHLCRRERRIRPIVLEAAFGAASLLSVVALYLWLPGQILAMMKDMVVVAPSNRPSIDQLRQAFDEKPEAFGRLYVDHAIAALAIESMHAGQLVTPGVRDADVIAFRQNSNIAGQVMPDIAAMGMSHCTHLLGTDISLCHREGFVSRALVGIPAEVVPPVLTVAFTNEKGRTAPARGILTKDDELGLAYAGIFSQMKGDYVARWKLDVVFADKAAHEAISAEIVENGAIKEVRRIDGNQTGLQEMVIPFHVTKATDFIELRLWRWAHIAVTIVHATIERPSSTP